MVRLPSFQKNANRVLGVDIGHEWIKVAEIEMTKQGAEITALGRTETPLRSVSDGRVENPSSLAQALQDLLKKMKVQTYRAIGGIAGPTVTLRPIQLPPMRDTELQTTLLTEVPKYIPNFNPLDMILEYQVAGRALPFTGEEPLVTILLASAPRLVVESRMQALELAGLEVLAIDIDLLALMRALLETQPELIEGGTTAILNLGGYYTEIAFFAHGIPLQSRSLTIGGIALTNALANIQGLPYEEAARIKEEIDCLDLNMAEAGTPQRAFRSALEELTREILRVMNAFRLSFQEGTEEGHIQKVFLAGGGACLKNLGTFLAPYLESEVVVGSLGPAGIMKPRGVIANELAQSGPLYLTAIGLALWEYFRHHRPPKGGK